MKKPAVILSLLLLFIHAIPCEGITPFYANRSLMKRRVLSDLDTIRSVFDVKYAPREWKEAYNDWDLDTEIAIAKNRVENHPNPTLKECQVAIRDFFNSTCDYHVGVSFFSTESAALPFEIKSAEGRYFICHIDRDELPRRNFPFEVGDELLTFGGEPIDVVVQRLRVEEYGDNIPETDQALAEMTLTHRLGSRGHRIPKGRVAITGIQNRSGKTLEATLNWGYVPEKIRDFSTLGLEACRSDANWVDNSPQAIKNCHFFDKFMHTYLWDKRLSGKSIEMHGHELGSRQSFIPPLGKRLWKTDSDTFFDAYIFELPNQKRVGYIRLPHFGGDEEEVEEFGALMNFFERYTEALVIDQVNNPGGSVFYLYALVSTLTDKPLYAPKHHLALTQDEVYLAQYLLPHLEEITGDSSARETFGETIGGYPIDYDFVKLTKKFCHHIIDQWGEGKLYTEPTHMFGVDKVKPHPYYRYRKPILLLTNGLDFSGGDFFPAILQDNKRATIFGSRTAGAGGYVLGTSFPNHSGIRFFGMTGSLAERINQDPIENLGVKPDTEYQLSVIDLQENYPEYVEAIVEAVEKLVK